MNNKFKILIIEDELNICHFVKTILESNGYQVVDAHSGSVGKMQYLSHCPDLVILDLGLPDIDGNDLISFMRESSATPIIVLSARSHESDKVNALDLGANDYMTKPFNMLELKARIKNIFRRTGGIKSESESELYKSGDLTVNTQNRSVEINEVEINLTAKEFDLLLLFISNKGKVFTREALSEAIWKHVGDIRTVDVHIRRLREKIEADPAKPEYIMTKWGVGYYFANK